MPTMTAEFHQVTRELLAERRVTRRFPCCLEAQCRSGDSKTGLSWPAQVRNLSGKGAGLALPRLFPPGTLLTVQFRVDVGVAFVARMRVIHSYREADSGYHGCAFLRRLSEPEVDALMQCER